MALRKVHWDRAQTLLKPILSNFRARNSQHIQKLPGCEFERHCYASGSDPGKLQEDLDEQRKQQNVEYLKGDTVAPGKFGGDAASEPVQVNLGPATL